MKFSDVCSDKRQEFIIMADSLPSVLQLYWSRVSETCSKLNQQHIRLECVQIGKTDLACHTVNTFL